MVPQPATTTIACKCDQKNNIKGLNSAKRHQCELTLPEDIIKTLGLTFLTYDPVTGTVSRPPADATVAVIMPDETTRQPEAGAQGQAYLDASAELQDVEANNLTTEIIWLQLHSVMAAR